MVQSKTKLSLTCWQTPLLQLSSLTCVDKVSVSTGPVHHHKNKCRISHISSSHFLSSLPPHTLHTRNKCLYLLPPVPLLSFTSFQTLDSMNPPMMESPMTGSLLMQRQFFFFFYSWALPFFLKHLLQLVLCFGPPSISLLAPIVSCISFSSSLQHSNDPRIQFSKLSSFPFSFHLMNLRCLLYTGNFQVYTCPPIYWTPTFIYLHHTSTYIYNQ